MVCGQDIYSHSGMERDPWRRVDVSLNINLQEKYCITHEVDRQRKRVDTDIWDVFTAIYSVTLRCLACDNNVWYPDIQVDLLEQANNSETVCLGSNEAESKTITFDV